MFAATLGPMLVFYIGWLQCEWHCLDLWTSHTASFGMLKYEIRESQLSCSMTDGFICEMKNLLQAIQNWNLKIFPESFITIT